jgi:hypothetical protein
VQDESHSERTGPVEDNEDKEKSTGDKFKGVIQGYLQARDLNDVKESLREMKLPELHSQLVKQVRIKHGGNL